jgi:hypothetical protein
MNHRKHYNFRLHIRLDAFPRSVVFFVMALHNKSVTASLL